MRRAGIRQRRRGWQGPPVAAVRLGLAAPDGAGTVQRSQPPRGGIVVCRRGYTTIVGVSPTARRACGSSTAASLSGQKRLDHELEISAPRERIHTSLTQADDPRFKPRSHAYAADCMWYSVA